MQNIQKLYTKIDKIGQGSFGEVSLIQQIATKKLFALKQIKIPDLSLKQKILQEFEIINKLKNPYLIQGISHYFTQIKAGFSSVMFLYIIMEYAKNGELTKNFSDFRSERNILKVYTQLRQALQYLHSEGFIHRDIKPQNILIDANHDCKITDLGAARKHEGLTIYTSRYIGTKYYLAPEFEDVIKFTEKVDLWALGIVILQLFFQIRIAEKKPKDYLKFIQQQKNKVPQGEIRNILDNLLQIECQNRTWALLQEEQRNIKIEKSDQGYSWKIVFDKIAHLDLIRFLNTTQIQKLNLQSNKISNIEILAKCNFRKLKILNLSNNQIQSISPLKDIFKIRNSSKPQKVEGKEVMVNEFIKPKIIKLNLKKNKIIKVDCLNQVDLPDLIQLDLSQNMISQMNIQSSNFPSLTQLLLNDNKIKSIDFLQNPNFKSLQIIRLDNNQITNIEVLNKCYFSNIKRLLLNQNQISDVDVLEYCKFQSLQILLLNRNKIQILPPAQLFKNLIQLQFGRNCVCQKDVNKSINLINLNKWSLNNIIHLNLERCGLIKVPDFTTLNLLKLQALQLQGNKFNNLNQMAQLNLPSLRFLFLYFNKLNNIDGLITAKFEKLQKLFLGWNDIQNVNDFLQNHSFKNIKLIDFQNNLIRRLPNIETIIEKAPNLQKLCMKNNIFHQRYIDLYLSNGQPKDILKKIQFKEQESKDLKTDSMK